MEDVGDIMDEVSYAALLDQRGTSHTSIITHAHACNAMQASGGLSWIQGT